MNSQDEAARYDSWSVALRHARLTRSGIVSLLNRKSDSGTDGVYRTRYAVHISGLHAIEVAKVEGANRQLQTPLVFSTQQPHASGGLLRQLEKMAVRSLYTLGLSSGEVLLVSNGGERKYAVEKITPSALIESKRLQRIYRLAHLEQTQKLEHELASTSSLMLGMDPEFLIVDPVNNEVVPASRFLDREGEVGCDAVHGNGVTTYPIAELRPLPSKDPRGLLIGLMRTLHMAGEMIQDRSLQWLAGGMPKTGLPLGGHLHFSGIELTAELLRALDNYLALPVSVLEANSSQLRRPKYGYLGDFRRQPHGGFEYRTLPSFLVSPLLAKGIVYLSYLIVSNYRVLERRPLEDEDRIHRAYYNGQREKIRECIEPLISDLQALEQYKEVKRYVDPLLCQIRSGGIWNEFRDFRPLWKLPFQS
ncbi:hypothetical protein MUG84_12630 [Paenibacillus sp. KQZ6P-2]|uniref:Phage phiEco32-like COOH-NH2 ligase-type 2 n=1 Tax=Paenibacillus mangrovi TaxID=2931978 RepID=A0A9X1WNM6_9BACL|nr:hypothetical protein [Paenibacillus mangrovi]MCJ8012577.1 hypothetical protein [Paenibacillus mangrovi]